MANIIAILNSFENKPRFSIDMVQKEYLKISEHFNGEKNTKKEVNNTDITFIKEVFKACFLLAYENNTFFDFGLQNGVVTFLKVKTNPFTISDNRTSEPITETEKFKKCFEKCAKDIDFSKVDIETLKDTVKILSKYLK